MVQHPHPRQPSKYSQLRACSLYLPSPLLCLTVELTLKSYCQFFLCKAMVEPLLGQKWRDRVQPRGPTGMGDGVTQGEPLAQPHGPRRWHGCRCPDMLPKHRSPRGRCLDLLPAACGRRPPSVRHGTARGAWPRGAEVGCLCCCCQIHTCGSGKKSQPVIWALGQVRGKIAGALLFWSAFILRCSVTQQSVGLCAKLPSGVSCHEKLSG